MLKYNEIARKIIEDIYKGEYKVNDKLPSEKSISIRFGVSRIVASKVFSELRKIGAIYSVPKKGYFVAKYFEGLIKPLSFEYQIDKISDDVHPIDQNKMFEKEEWIIDDSFLTLERKYFRNNELIINSEIWLKKEEWYKKEESITDILLDEIVITSSVTITKFEKFKNEDEKESLVSYRVYFFDEGIACIYRYVVDPKHFKLIKQEFNII